MNEVKRCSISGIAFTMDSDAYTALHNYIDTLNKRYSKEPDGKEIIADIEARIAELILSTHDNSQVVERPLIENIIAQLGSADAISEESGTESESTTQSEPRIPRRLYRDMENAKLGGVCSGVARYFDIDPVWIRLAMFIPLLITPFSGISAVWLSLSAICGNLFGVFLLTYLVLWFAIPAARSPRQRLEMTGEKITEQSIREAAAANPSSDADTKARPIVANTVTALGGCLLALFKIVAAVVIFGLSLGVVALSTGIVAIIATEGSLIDMGSLSDALTLTGSEVVLSVLGILTVLIPIILLLYVLICLFFSRKPSRTTSIVLFVLWILILFALCFTAIKTSHDIYTLNDIENLGDNIENRIESIEDAAESAIENKIESVVGSAVESGGSVTINIPSGAKIDIQETVQSGGTFRKTTINIDK
ncbi:MAG: PspC domain-containing protein [Alistipes sp.]|nr:PspC domain-containing protein [Alistipes sp.]